MGTIEFNITFPCGFCLKEKYSWFGLKGCWSSNQIRQRIKTEGCPIHGKKCVGVAKC